eukprot:2844699-Rhodomonas_salina.1
MDASWCVAQMGHCKMGHCGPTLVNISCSSCVTSAMSTLRPPTPGLTLSRTNTESRTMQQLGSEDADRTIPFVQHHVSLGSQYRQCA